MMELLSPGGSLEGLKAAVHAGADAVYTGGSRFGARAYADNPKEEELLEAIDYCHIHGRKLYLTVNTLLKEEEIGTQLLKDLLPVCRQGLDGVLVQDLGVLSLIRRELPGLPVHASTQMSVQSVQGARWLKGQGVVRIVPARELSLEEIKKISAGCDIEVECFAHGALCWCYSGQCLLSSMIGGRSGNRGRCAQPCRQPYELFKEGKKQSDPAQPYLMSLKDICTLDLLPDLYEAGIASLKIEGRMKRPEYAAGVTAIYRKYCDLYEKEGKAGYRVDPQDKKILMDLYCRGDFSDGYYYTKNGPAMMAMRRPNHSGTKAALVQKADRRSVVFTACEKLEKGDILDRALARAGEGVQVTVKEEVPEGARFSVPNTGLYTKPRDVWRRVRCEKLLQDLASRYLSGEPKEKIKGFFALHKDAHAILELFFKDYKVRVTGGIPSGATGRGTDEGTVAKQLRKTGNTPFIFDELKIQCDDGLFFPLTSLNQMRREALELLKEQICASCRRTDAAPAASYRMQETVHFAPVTGADAGKNGHTQIVCSVEEPRQMAPLLERDEVSAVYLDSCRYLNHTDASFIEDVERIKKAAKKALLILPPVWREKVREDFFRRFTKEELETADGFLVRIADQIEDFVPFAGSKELVADSSLYTMNREASKLLQSLGFSRDTASLEENARELKERGMACSELIVYGYLPVMVTAQCLEKNTSRCRHAAGCSSLKDRTGRLFPVRHVCGICTNVIYNADVLDLSFCVREIKELNASAWRLNFTFEDPEECRAVIKRFCDSFYGGTAPEGEEARNTGRSGRNTTRGRFRRGVE